MALDLFILEPYDQEQSAFEALAAPRRTARGRENDRFFIMLAQHGSEQLDAPALKSWLQRLALHFFDQGGSVTRALQAVADRANDDALVQNVNHPDPLHPYACDLLAGVLHHDVLLVIQAGDLGLGTLEGGEWQKHNDAALALHPLGLAAAPKTALFQVPLSAFELLAMGRRLPQSGSTLEQLPLFDWLDAATAHEARVLLQARPGEGSVRSLPRAAVLALWQQDVNRVSPATETEPLENEGSLPDQGDPESAETDYVFEDIPEQLDESTDMLVDTSSPPAEGENLTPEAPALEAEQDLPLETVSDEGAPIAAPAPPDLHADAGMDPQPVSFEQELTQGLAVPATPAELPDPEDDLLLQLRQEREAQRLAARAAEQVQRQQAQKENLEKAKQTALRGVAGGAGFLNRLDAKMRSRLNKTDPKTGEPLYKPVSLLTKILLAILVPLAVVIVAGGIYLARGRNTQFNEYLSLAQDTARRAAQMDSDGERQTAWTQVLAYLNRAEALERTDETTALRQEAQLALDGLDNATPIQFARINMPLGSGTAQITHLAAYNLDLFALDQASGSVLHFMQKDGGFNYDTAFTCGPGNYGGVNVDKLLVFASIPFNNAHRAPIVAMDGAGNLLYCAVGQAPVAAQLSLPEGGWGKPVAAAYDNGRLLVLDAEKERLWVYRGAADALENPPASYFEDQEMDLGKARDFTISGDELFVLYEDGHSAHCVSSAISGTMECANPAAYQDERAGVSPQDFNLVQPQRLAFAPPPEAAVYYLDPRMGRLYQFSLRLNLNSVLRPAPSSLGLPIQPVTAFLVTPNRLVFYAYANQLFYSYLP